MISPSTPLNPGTGWLATTGPRDLWRVIAQTKVEKKPTDNVKIFFIQGGFFNWSALKMTKCQTLRKF